MSRGQGEPTTPSRPSNGSRPQTPGPHTPKTPHTPASSNYSSYSAFSGSPLAARLPPVHLSTTGRGELLRWINDVLDMDLADISDANNGAAACQMMDRLNPYHPIINMRRVDCNARDHYSMTKNWRILQLSFVELEIEWNVDVERCQKGHQMDLLLLFRLLKQRYDTWQAELEGLGQELPPYDAKARRAMSKTGDFRDPLAPAPSLPRTSPVSKRRLVPHSNGIAAGDGDSALEWSGDKEMVSEGTQMGSSFNKQQIKQRSIWQKFKRAMTAK